MKQDALYYVKDNTLFDNQNRMTFFRGCNYTETELFPIEEADSRFNKLLLKGCNLIRWGITWEKVEPEPEAYNEEYLANLRNLIKKADEYDIKVIIEPLFSCWCKDFGGIGAPAWTYEKIGINFKAENKETGTWSWKGAENYASRTMNTLFFAGHTFAKGLKIDGDPVQDYLQEHFINAMNHTARRLKDCENIIGFGIMSDISAGYIDTKNLLESDFAKDTENQNWKDFWGQFGAITTPDYFAINTGDFNTNYLLPFAEEYVETLQKKHKHYIFFTNIKGIENTENVLFSEGYNKSAPKGKTLFAKADTNFEETISNWKKTSLLTEFASLNVGNTAKETEDTKAFYDKIDEKLISACILNYNENLDSKCYVRPYVSVMAGTLVKQEVIFDKEVTFTIEWDSNLCPTSSGDADTEIFIPKVWFPNGWKTEKFDGVGILREVPEQQKLYVKTLEARRCKLIIKSV